MLRVDRAGHVTKRQYHTIVKACRRVKMQRRNSRLQLRPPVASSFAAKVDAELQSFHTRLKVFKCRNFCRFFNFFVRTRAGCSNAALDRMAAHRRYAHLQLAGWMATCFCRQIWWTAMTTHLTPHNHAPQEKLHPFVYRLMVGLAAWFVLSIWLLFDRGSYVGLNLAIITTFFLIAVGIPLIIAFTWWRNSGVRGGHAMRFHEWLACEFTTWTGGLSGTEAAIQILLPIAAVSIGMTIFGLVLHFDLPNIH